MNNYRYVTAISVFVVALASLRAQADSHFCPQFILTNEHVDVRIVQMSGQLGLRVFDNDRDMNHLPEDVLLYVGEAGKVPRPNSEDYNFIGTAPGAQFWRLPQIQDPALMLLGVNAETVPSGTVLPYVDEDGRLPQVPAPWISVALDDMRGPGNFSVWSEGSFGAPTNWMSTADGIGAADRFYTLEGGHIDFNWGFTATGIYEVDFVASAVFDLNSNGEYDPGVDTVRMTDPVTYYFGIEDFGPTPPLGDADVDCDVDLNDLNLVRNNFGGEGAGDTDGDSDVDLEDLNNVRNNFGAVATASATSVPEPSMLVLCAVGCIALLTRRTFVRIAKRIPS